MTSPIPNQAELSVFSAEETMTSQQNLSHHTLQDPTDSKTDRFIKGLYCFLLTMVVSTTWVASTQLGRDTYVKGKFEAPFLVMYTWTCVPVFIYPIYVGLKFSFSRGKTSPSQDLRNHLRLYNPEEIPHVGRFIGYTALFCVLWCLTTYTFLRALDPYLLKAADVSAIYATHFCFVYLLSWIALYEKFVAFRIVAVILSITCIVLYAYADGFGTPSMWGVVLSVGSSSTVAIYKVLIKKFFKSTDIGRMTFFISLIGLGNALCMWPIVLCLAFTNVEIVTSPSVPYDALIPSAILFAQTLIHLFAPLNVQSIYSFLYFLLVVMQLMTTFMHGMNYKLFIGLGYTLGIIICTVADNIWRQQTFAAMEIGGIIMSILGLLLLMLPTQCPSVPISPQTKWRWPRSDSRVQNINDTQRVRLQRSTRM